MKLTQEQLSELKEINSCLKPEGWNKKMYDAFMLGYRMAKYDGKELKEKKEGKRL